MDIANIEAVAKLNTRRSRLLETLDVLQHGMPSIICKALETRWRAAGTREVDAACDVAPEALNNALICLLEDELLQTNAALSKLGVSTPLVQTYNDPLPPDADLAYAKKGEQGWRQLAVMMQRAWQREIGKVRHKAHWIDEFVLSISDLRAQADALKPLVIAADEYFFIAYPKPAPDGSSPMVGESNPAKVLHEARERLDSALAAARKVLP